MRINCNQVETVAISEDWERVKLDDVIILYHGYPFRSAEYSNNGKYIVVTIANVQRGKMVMDTYNTIDHIPSDLQNYQKLVKGDCLISMTGNVGRVCLVTRNNCLLNQRVGKIVPNQIYNSRYIYLILNSDDFISSMIESAKGGAQPNISKKDILEYEFSIPKDRKEQQCIAEALSDVDALIASLEKMIAKKKAIKQGAMQRLLTGKTRLPGFEGEWEEFQVEEVASFPTVTVLLKKIDTRNYVGTDNMIADKGGIRDNEIDIEYNNVREYKVGDILLSNIRPYLKKIWFADRCGGCSNDVLVIRSKDENITTPHFLFYLLSQDRFFDEITENAIGTKMPRGDKSVIKSFVLHIPSDISEQKKITAVISDMDAEIESLSQKLAKTRQLKQGMMQQLLTGKIRLV